MAQFDHVLNRFVDAVFILDADVPDQLTGRFGITQDHRYSGGGEFGSHAFVHRRGDNRDAANVTLPEFSHDRLGSFPVIFGVADQDVKSAVPRPCLITPDDLGKVRIGNFGNDESKQIAASGRQTPGMHVLEIVEFTNGIEHTPAGCFRDILSMVENARDCGQRYSGSPGDFTHGVGHSSFSYLLDGKTYHDLARKATQLDKAEPLG